MLSGKPSENENSIKNEDQPESIFVGHGVVTDLKVINLQEVFYYDTHVIDFNYEMHHSRKLKDLCSKYLNAKI